MYLNANRPQSPGQVSRAAGGFGLTPDAAVLYIAGSRAVPRPLRPYPCEGHVMTRRCELTGIGPMVGNNVSHSNTKTKRRFLPALSPASLASDALGQTFRLRISNAALRTIDFRGGLDPFLLKASDEQLSLRARKIKRQLKAKLSAQPAA